MKQTPFVFKYTTLFILSILFGFTSCKKDKFETNSTGKSVLSEADLLNLNTIDTTITLNSYPVLADSVKTDEIAETALLGSYVDPVFGKTSTSIYTQFRFLEAHDFSSVATDGDIANLVIDDITLTLPISDFYGKLDPQVFEVYQMTENIELASDYYSNKSISTSATNLVVAGTETITPNITGGKIEISIDPALGADIIAQNGTSVLSSNDDFVNWFKGFYITTNTTQSEGEGAILSILMNGADSVRLTMNYRKDAGSTNVLKYEMVVDANAARFNKFSHNYTSTTVNDALNDADKGNTEFYIQPLAGVNTEISFPYLSNLSKIEGLVIRDAKLILPFESSSTYAESENLVALGFNSDGENVFITDQFIGSAGGEVNTSDQNYSLTLTNFINQVVKGDISDNRLLIAPVGASVTPNRTIFNGQKSTKDNKIELKISYTIF